MLVWVPSETKELTFGEDASDSADDKEFWRVRHMFRSLGSEIYDLAWSPDGAYVITGSMDNTARIYDAKDGQLVRQVAEHNHFVQGVAWDPLNEFVATQSSDRSVHIWQLRRPDAAGLSLAQHARSSHATTVVSTTSLTPIEASASPLLDHQHQQHATTTTATGLPPPTGAHHHYHHHAQQRLSVSSNSPFEPAVAESPVMSSGPSTPASMTPITASGMQPPLGTISHSRKSSFNGSPAIRQSLSPISALPLPAVKPSLSPNPSSLSHIPTSATTSKSQSLYSNESLLSFFRRLTFSPDGSLLFAPAGVLKKSTSDHDDTLSTVYIYTRAGFNRPPAIVLPGLRTASIAVRCSPIYYKLRTTKKPLSNVTTHVTIDTSSESAIPPLPPPAAIDEEASPVEKKLTEVNIPRSSSAASNNTTATTTAAADDIPLASTLALPYRMIYAVATQDAILVYDTQQQAPICVVSNLHYATFTDLTWYGLILR